MPHTNIDTTGHVLVLGKGIRAFLTVIRSLGRAGLKVHTGMCPSNELALKSRYAWQHHHIPEYSPDSSEWLETIIRLAKEHKFDLIIPTHDESAIPIQLYKKELRTHVNVYALEDKTFSTAFDKVKCSFLAEKLGICIPRQLALPVNELNNLAQHNFQLPLMVKPPSSYTADDLGTRREVIAIRNEYQLSEFVENSTAWGTVLIQEIFEGRGVGVEILAQDGEVLTAFQHLRVHEPLAGGASSYRKSTAINPELFLATKKLIRHLNYTGVAMVEYKIDLETGEWIFIEINGRFWGSLPLAVAAGADFPYFLYQMLVLGKKEFSRDHKTEIYCRNLLRDLYWFTDNLHNRLRNEPSPLSIPLHKVILEFLNILKGKEHIDSFTIDDPRPGLIEIGEFVSLFAKKLASIITGKLTNSYPFRWFKSRKILKAAKHCQSILFVCYGNICRSPFAEYYAKSSFPNSIKIYSSGFHQKEQRQAPQQAISTANDFGIDTRSHRSNIISNSYIQKADMILVFDEKNLEMMAAQYPESLNKTFLLGDALITGHREIDDPYGEDGKTFTKTFDQIIKAIDKIRIV